ncbi:MAG: serine/threonine protein kinase [Planctomycetaceae bacterium]|nr:serine/threonine protein kinase [Planctomycetaceae bacterium]
MLKARQRLGKYRIEKRISDGGFATVFRAMDTIEGIRVALKIPHAENITPEVLNDFRQEVRLAVQLEHPHILPLKNASFIDGQFVIAFPLGERTLGDRLTSRISLKSALDYAEQMIDAVAFAHRHRIIHCDIKPENLILFPGNRLKLTDFGIAKVAQKTVRGSGTGTVGYMAPEQAMGKPSLRSDVFSLGLILYRMLSGKWPEWPFDWPPPNFFRVRGRVHPDLIAVIHRAIEPNPRKRYRDAEQMLKAFLPAKAKALQHAARKKRNGHLTR